MHFCESVSGVLSPELRGMYSLHIGTKVLRKTQGCQEKLELKLAQGHTLLHCGNSGGNPCIFTTTTLGQAIIAPYVTTLTRNSAFPERDMEKKVDLVHTGCDKKIVVTKKKLFTKHMLANFACRLFFLPPPNKKEVAFYH